jgi:hypothetical protein
MEEAEGERRALGIFPERMQRVVQRYGPFAAVLSVVTVAIVVATSTSFDVALAVEILLPIARECALAAG